MKFKNPTEKLKCRLDTTKEKINKTPCTYYTASSYRLIASLPSTPKCPAIVAVENISCSKSYTFTGYLFFSNCFKKDTN